MGSISFTLCASGFNLFYHMGNSNDFFINLFFSNFKSFRFEGIKIKNKRKKIMKERFIGYFSLDGHWMIVCPNCSVIQGEPEKHKYNMVEFKVGRSEAICPNCEIKLIRKEKKKIPMKTVCPKCKVGKLEEISSSGVEDWVEGDLGYKCNKCGFVILPEDYKKI